MTELMTMRLKKNRLIFAVLILVVAVGLVITIAWRHLGSVKSLRFAVLRGDPPAVQRAIWLGADINHQIDPDGGFVGLSDELAILSERRYPALPAFGGLTPLMFAAMGTDTEISEILVQAGADLDLVNYDGWPALNLAVSFSDASMVDYLLDAGADPNLTAAGNGASALTSAIGAETESVEKVQLLVAAGAGIDSRAFAGLTPLELAAIDGEPRTVQLLLDVGADPHGKDVEGRTALYWAQRQIQARPDEPGRTEVIELLKAAMGLTSETDP